MKYLHAMLRIRDIEQSLKFFVDILGLIEVRRKDDAVGRFTLIYLATDIGEPEIELTYNWDRTLAYTVGDHFGHIAFSVAHIYDYCQKLLDNGVNILRPPRDGYMAFIRSPDQISIELLQEGERLPIQEPWVSMPNQGNW